MPIDTEGEVNVHRVSSKGISLKENGYTEDRGHTLVKFIHYVHTYCFNLHLAKVSFSTVYPLLYSTFIKLHMFTILMHLVKGNDSLPENSKTLSWYCIRQITSLIYSYNSGEMNMQTFAFKNMFH